MREQEKRKKLSLELFFFFFFDIIKILTILLHEMILSSQKWTKWVCKCLEWKLLLYYQQFQQIISYRYTRSLELLSTNRNSISILQWTFIFLSLSRFNYNYDQYIHEIFEHFSRLKLNWMTLETRKYHDLHEIKYWIDFVDVTFSWSSWH